MGSSLLNADIAVLGAGSAGIAAALALRNRGLEVVLVGESATGEFKVGEFLPAAALRLLRALGFAGLDDVLTEDDYLRSNAKMSAWGSDRWTYQDSVQDPEGGGWHILRHRFEHRLLAKAIDRDVPFYRARLTELADDGVDFRLRAAAADGELTVICPRLIDATGRKAWLVRRLAGAPRKSSDQMAVTCWLEDGSATEERVTRVKSVANGWWYTAPLPGRKRVCCFHGLAQDVGELVKRPGRFTDEADRIGLGVEFASGANSATALQACDASVRISPNVAGKRWLAIGDAALSFDPLSSQGLHFALYSAVMACDAIRASLESEAQAFAAAQRYCEQVSEVFRANQRARYLFYGQEMRFRDAEYWQVQRSGLAA